MNYETLNQYTLVSALIAVFFIVLVIYFGIKKNKIGFIASMILVVIFSATAGTFQTYADKAKMKYDEQEYASIEKDQENYSDDDSDSESEESSEETSSEESDSSDESSSDESDSSEDESNEKVSAEYRAALKSAEYYSNNMRMSKVGIYDQLVSDAGDKFTSDAAQYAVDHVNADWKKNALKSAKSYQQDMNLSTEAIRDQLTSDAGEKFTQEEADYAIKHLND